MGVVIVIQWKLVSLVGVVVGSLSSVVMGLKARSGRWY